MYQCDECGSYSDSVYDAQLHADRAGHEDFTYAGDDDSCNYGVTPQLGIYEPDTMLEFNEWGN